MYSYIEIEENKTSKVVERIDVTGESERVIDRIERGVNINLNHKLYRTCQVDSKTQLRTEKEKDEKYL